MTNPFSLKGKTILVTGASSGLGRSTAIECSKMGATVIVNARNETRLDETLSMMEGPGHKKIVADISTDEGISTIVNNCSILNGIVHSAGLSSICPVKFINRERINQIVGLNTLAPILITSALIKNKKIQKDSSIVFIASMSGVCIGNTGESIYSTSKAALSGFTKSAAYELGKQNIRINTICPGVIPTELLQLSNSTFTEEELNKLREKYPLKRFGKPEEVAWGAIYLLSDASRWVTGTNLIVDGGYTIV